MLLIAVWAIVTGVFQIWAAIRLRERIRGEFWLGLAGVASILFGVILLRLPGGRRAGPRVADRLGSDRHRRVPGDPRLAPAWRPRDGEARRGARLQPLTARPGDIILISRAPDASRAEQEQSRERARGAVGLRLGILVLDIASSPSPPGRSSPRSPVVGVDRHRRGRHRAAARSRGSWSVGFTMVEPNIARVVIFLGRYAGTIRRTGFVWTVPLTAKPCVQPPAAQLRVGDAEGQRRDRQPGRDRGRRRLARRRHRAGPRSTSTTTRCS